MHHTGSQFLSKWITKIMFKNHSAFPCWKNRSQPPSPHLSHCLIQVQSFRLADYVSVPELVCVLLLRILQDLPITDLSLRWFPRYWEHISPATLSIWPGLGFNEKHRGGGEWCRCRSLCQEWGSPFSSAGWFAGWDCWWLGNDLEKSNVKEDLQMFQFVNFQLENKKIYFISSKWKRFYKVTGACGNTVTE